MGSIWAAAGLWSGVVLAGRDEPPVTCQVVFMTPTRYCSWDGTFSAEGSGPNEKKARRVAVQRLLTGVEREAEARLLQTQGTLAAARALPDRESCPAAVEQEARVSCFPSLDLERSLTCFASFEDEACWLPQMVSAEGVGWKAMERARVGVCEQLDLSLSQSTLSEAQQMACRARCQMETEIRCPALSVAK